MMEEELLGTSTQAMDDLDECLKHIYSYLNNSALTYASRFYLVQ